MECNPEPHLAAGLFRPLTPVERTRMVTLVLTGVILFLLQEYTPFIFGAFTMMPRNDFGRPLMATELFLDGKDMYGDTEATECRVRFDPLTVIRLRDLNPPHSHLLYVPFAYMPRWVALGSFLILSGFCLYAALQIIIRELGIEMSWRRWQWTLVGLFSFTATGVVVATAHMSFELLLLTTLTWRNARHGRWYRAGGWLGLLVSIKPFFLIFVPYLILKGCWRGLVSMGLTAAAAFLVGILLFGVDSHASWVRTISQADSWAWLPGNASLYGLISRNCQTNPLYTSIFSLDAGLVRRIWLMLGIPLGIIALLRSVSEPLVEGVDRAFAILLVTAVLLSPLGWLYYFWLPMPPVAALAHAWWVKRSRTAGEKGVVVDSVSGHLFLISMAGMAFPWTLLIAFQPSAVATIVLGSIPFLSLLLCWLAVIVDEFDPGLIRARVGSWTSRKLISGSA